MLARLQHAALAVRTASAQRTAAYTERAAASAAAAAWTSGSSRRSLPLTLRRGFASNNRGNRGTIATASVVVDAAQQQNGTAATTRGAISATGSSAVADSASSSSSVPYLRASSTTISDVLSVYQADGRTFTCSASASLYDAVRIMVSSRVGCLVAMEEDGEHVAGLVTERDILSEMVRLQDGEDETSSNWSTTPVSSAMTRSREMVHIRPGDLIDDALKLMTSQGFRHLPVLESTPEGNHLRGMVSMRNLVDVIYKHKDAGGKAQFLYDILPRTGVPKNTALRKKGAAPNTASGGAATGGKGADAPYPSLFLNAGICAIPHPDKKAGEDSYVAVVANVNVNQESGGAAAAASSSSSSPSPASSSSSSSASLSRPFSVLAVFDGVGSWSFEQGLDPAKFSNACAEGLKAYIDGHPTLSPSEDAAGRASAATAASLLQSAPTPLSPSCMLNAVWDFVCKRRVVGSSTACILALAHHSNELRATNIGDSGFLVLRHRDAQRQLHMGSVGATTGAQASGAPDYQVVYRSPQQLHYFNCPLQIGIDTAGAIDKFESPVDADLLSVPLQDGDLIVLATDGLFDNVPEESIVAEVGRSMEKIAEADPTTQPLPTSTTSGTADRPALHTGPVSPLTPVARALAQLAYRLSLDKMTDSPFALLAKDNNIMWKNGGRKDDITVIVARVDTIPTTTPRA